MSDLKCRRWGMTMRTPAGSVDLVPLFRKLDGESADVLADERDAAVLALTHLGHPVQRICSILNTHAERVREVLAERGVAEVAVPKAISMEAVVRTTTTQRRAYRRGERIEVDGRMVHPEAPHGTDLGYTDYCCECGPCKAAHTAKLAEYRAKKARAA